MRVKQLVVIVCLFISSYLISCKEPIPEEKGETPPPVVADMKEANAFISSINFRELEPKNSMKSTSPYQQFYPCDVSAKPIELKDLTQAERLLLFGYELLDEYDAPYNPQQRFQPVTTLLGMMMRYYAIYESLPKTADDLFECYYSFYKDDFEKEGKTLEAARADFVNMIKSPVTNKPIDWQNQNFSAGNVYIAVINDNPDAMKIAETKFRESLGVAGEQAKPRFDGFTVYLYCRVYGESGVIDNIDMSHFWSNEMVEDMKAKLASSGANPQ